MIQANTLIAGAAAIALSLGVTGEGTIPKELQFPWATGTSSSSKTTSRRQPAKPTQP